MRDLDDSGRDAHTCVIALVLLLGAASGARAQEAPDTVATDTTEHVVREGDTLWDLAGLYYTDPFRWPMIHEANVGVVEDPHWIYPRERLLIPGLLTGARGDGAPRLRARSSDPLLEPHPIARTRFYDPTLAPTGDATVISTEPTSTERVVRRGEFRAAPWLEPTSALRVVARLARPVEPALAEAIARPAVTIYDEVLLAADGGEAPAVGERLVLVRPVRGIAPWGDVIMPVAVVRVAAHGEELITAEVIEHFDRIEEGDRAVVPEPYPVPEGVRPQPIDGGATGRLLEFEVEGMLYGVGDIAFVDLGRDGGIEVGDELVTYLPPRRVRSEGGRRTPSEPIAELRVVRVTERTATVRVLRLRYPVLEPGMPVRVVRKMP